MRVNLDQIFVRHLGTIIQNLRLHLHIKELVVTENDVNVVVNLIGDIRLPLLHNALLSLKE